MLLPIIGITCDIRDDRYSAAPHCASAVAEAGGLPVLLPCLADCGPSYVAQCDGIILSGGDPRLSGGFFLGLSWSSCS